MSPAMRRKKVGDPKISEELEARIKRGRERLEKISATRDEAWEFYRGNHYAFVDENHKLQFQDTVTTVRGGGKPRWMPRQKRNLVFDAVLHIAAAASSRVPGYQVIPTTGDPDDQSAAKLSEKVLRYGYRKWRIRRMTIDAVIHAVVGGEAFIWPFFDNTVGPYILGENIGEGEIRNRVFGSNECYWEPGLRFEDSPWHVVEHARPVERVMSGEGFMGKPLTPDAEQRSLSGKGKGRSSKGKLVVVTEYLEMPTAKNPEGKWITIANGRRIREDQPYPTKYRDSQCVLRRLSFAPDPDSDRDLGLVPQLLDAQRTKNDAINKQVLWKELCLQPQFAVTPGTFLKQRRTNEPAKVYQIPQPNENLKVIDVPPVPTALFEMDDRAERDIGRIAGQNALPTNPTSGKEIAERLEKDDSRMGLFYGEVAEMHAQVAHDDLCLVAEHYTEPRLLQIKGDFGWETVKDFKGAQLRDQVDVEVLQESVTPRTKSAIEQRVMNYAQMGWISPDAAISAIETGTAEPVVRGVTLNESRAGRIIQRILEGPDVLFAMPEMPTGRTIKQPVEQPVTDPMTGQPAVDPMTGQPITETVMVDTGQAEMGPGWMPRYSDNLAVFRATFEDWMKTEDYERLAPEQHQAAALIYSGILMLETERAAEQQALQAAQAEQHGMANAAKDQGHKPHASLPKLQSQNGSTS